MLGGILGAGNTESTHRPSACGTNHLMEDSDNQYKKSDVETVGFYVGVMKGPLVSRGRQGMFLRGEHC